MNEIVEYAVIEATKYDPTFNPDNVPIEEWVATAIKEGWQPLGGIAVAGTRLYQAMVKYKEPIAS